MSNPNTLCYRISAMQVLLHNPKFVAWVESLHTADDCKSNSFLSLVSITLTYPDHSYLF